MTMLMTATVTVTESVAKGSLVRAMQQLFRTRAGGRYGNETAFQIRLCQFFG